jgi:hypothetical protein
LLKCIFSIHNTLGCIHEMKNVERGCCNHRVNRGMRVIWMRVGRPFNCKPINRITNNREVLNKIALILCLVVGSLSLVAPMLLTLLLWGDRYNPNLGVINNYYNSLPKSELQHQYLSLRYIC